MLQTKCHHPLLKKYNNRLPMYRQHVERAVWPFPLLPFHFLHVFCPWSPSTPSTWAKARAGSRMHTIVALLALKTYMHPVVLALASIASGWLSAWMLGWNKECCAEVGIWLYVLEGTLVKRACRGVCSSCVIYGRRSWFVLCSRVVLQDTMPPAVMRCLLFLLCLSAI